MTVEPGAPTQPTGHTDGALHEETRGDARVEHPRAALGEQRLTTVLTSCYLHPPKRDPSAL